MVVISSPIWIFAIQNFSLYIKRYEDSSLYLTSSNDSGLIDTIFLFFEHYVRIFYRIFSNDFFLFGVKTEPIFLFPFFFVGIIQLFKKKELISITILFALLVAPIPLTIVSLTSLWHLDDLARVVTAVPCIAFFFSIRTKCFDKFLSSHVLNTPARNYQLTSLILLAALLFSTWKATVFDIWPYMRPYSLSPEYELLSKYANSYSPNIKIIGRKLERACEFAYEISPSYLEDYSNISFQEKTVLVVSNDTDLASKYFYTHPMCKAIKSTPYNHIFICSES